MSNADTEPHTTAHIAIYSPGYSGEADHWSGQVNARDLDDIFQQFNRNSPEDALRLQVLGFNQPSMSVGDFIVVHTSSQAHVLEPGFYIVLPLGFAQVTKDDYQLTLTAINPPIVASAIVATPSTSKAATSSPTAPSASSTHSGSTGTSGSPTNPEPPAPPPAPTSSNPASTSGTKTTAPKPPSTTRTRTSKPSSTTTSARPNGNGASRCTPRTPKPTSRSASQSHPAPYPATSGKCRHTT